MLSSSDRVAAGNEWRPSARVHNEFVDATQRFTQMALSSASSKRPGDHLEIYVASALSVDVGAVVGFGDPLKIPPSIGEARDRTMFAEAAPTLGRFAIAVDGSDANAAAACILAGVAWANVNVVDVGDTHADIVLGVLTSGTGGIAKILYKPGGVGVKLCCLYLCCGGSGTITCGTLHDIHDVPDAPLVPPNKFVPVYTTDGNCESIEVVECGQDVTPPCNGCTLETPTYLLMKLTGADFSNPADPTNPSINGFDIPIGQEILATRQSRCAYTGAIDYWNLGETPGVDPPSQMDVDLIYDDTATEWQLTFTAGAAVIGFTAIAGPHDCMVQHCWTADSGELDLTGYEFTGAVACFDPRATV